MRRLTRNEPTGNLCFDFRAAQDEAEPRNRRLKLCFDSLVHPKTRQSLILRPDTPACESGKPARRAICASSNHWNGFWHPSKCDGTGEGEKLGRLRREEHRDVSDPLINRKIYTYDSLSCLMLELMNHGVGIRPEWPWLKPCSIPSRQAGRLRYSSCRRHPGGSEARKMRVIRKLYRRPPACPKA